MNLSLLKHIYQFFKERNFIICIFLIFCITFSMRVYAINHKTTLFFDDPASFIASTPNNLNPEGNIFKYYWTNLKFEHRKNYKASEIKKALFESKSDLKSITKDIKTLHNHTIDPQHLNLYYSILRVWSSGMDYLDCKSMIIRGCSLNLIFFIFSFFFMYKLLSLIKDDKKFIALGLFFAFVTTGSISNFLLIRPYPLYETFFILAIYMFIVIYNSINNETNISKNKIILYSIGFGLFLLSTYYSLIMTAFISTIIIFKCLQVKNYKILKNYVIIISIAFLISYLFCPLYFENFKVIENMDTAKATINIWSFIDFERYGLYLIENLNEFIFYNIGFYIILFTMHLIGINIFGQNKFTKKEKLNLLIVLSVAIIYTYLIIVISPYNELPAARYILSGFTVISILLTLITYYLKNIYIINLIILTFISSFVPLQKGMTMYNTGYKNLGVITYYQDYNEYNLNNFLYKKNGELRPVVFLNKNWTWPNYIFYLPENATIRLEENSPENNYIFKDYILVNMTTPFDEKIILVNNNKKTILKTHTD